MSTLIVIPMKDPASAKTRLRPALGAGERERLARLLFDNTLAFFARQCPELPRLVVTESPAIALSGQQQGAQVLREEQRRGLNAALDAATQWALRQGHDATLFVAADVAVWEPDEVDALLAAGRDDTVVIAEAVDGGTNALYLPVPNACPFQFGPGSAVLHEIAAKQRGYKVRRMHLPFLARDVDTPDDLGLWDRVRHRGTRAERGT